MELTMNVPAITNFSAIVISLKEGETVRELLERVTVFNMPSIYPVVNLAVTMPCCGRVYMYATLDDVPTESVLCSCGKPNHYVIKVER